MAKIILHQTFSPSTCQCIIEEQFEYDDVTGENGQPSLWFFHRVCEKHLPLVKDKPKPSPELLRTQRQKIVDHHRMLLDKNRTRHLKEFDNHPNRKQKLETINELKKSLDTERFALKMEAQEAEERRKQESLLDAHEDKSMDILVMGIYSPYAFIAQEVYDAMREEQKQANPIIPNDIDN